MLLGYTVEILASLAIAVIYTPVTGCDIQCRCSNKEMVCNDYMPYELPSGVTSLTVDGNDGDLKRHQLWTDDSWDMLESLTLRNYQKNNIDLHIYNLSNLVNLTYFGLHSVYFELLSKQHLQVMPKLKELDLSGTIALTFPRIISALSGGNLPNLEVLNLDLVASDLAYTGMNRFDDTFVNVLVGKPLRKLIITNTMLEINLFAILRLHSLEFLNISGPWIPLFGPRLPTTFGRTFNTLDISNSAIHIFKTRTDYVLKDRTFFSCERNYFLDLLLNTSNVFINNVVGMSVSIVNVTISSPCFHNIFHTESLYLRKNGLKILDIEIDKNILSALRILDLSENRLEFISPQFLRMGNLSTLELMTNNLHQMEQNSNFELLFKYLKNLRYINLSFNKMYTIPGKMFLHNKQLSVINLSFNKISTVYFDIQHLSHLHVLNLEGNRIHIITTDFLQQLDTLSLEPSFSEHETNSNAIILNNNRISCTCKNIALLNWIVTRHEAMDSQDYPYCYLEDKLTRLDQAAVEESKYLCIKLAVTIAISTSSVSLTIATILLFLICYIRRNRRIQADKMKKLKRLLQAEKGLKYLSFLSFCGEDEDIARYKIYPKLLEATQLQIGCRRNIICFGDISMLPGFPIHEQIHDRISESYTVVVIVSNNFCESHWCEAELREAVYQRKPIIMFIVDRVDEALMSPYIQSVFRRYTRVKVTTKGDDLEFTPEVNVICRSMLELATYALHY